MVENFRVGDAAFHIFRVRAGNGFIWKYALAYACVALITYGLSFYIYAPVYADYISIFASANTDDPFELNRRILALNEEHRLRMLLSYLVALPAGLAFWACFDAAGQRRYMRGEGFSLRVGNDEFRLLGVGLLYWLCVMGAYFAGAVLVVVVGMIVYGIMQGGSGGGGVLVLLPILAGLTMLFAILWVGLRLSPAAALTIRDEKFKFSEAWKLTKGHFWQLLGANLILWVIFGIVFVTAYGAFMAWAFAHVMGAAGGSGLEAETVLNIISQPGFIGVAGGFFLVIMLLQGVIMHAVQGPPAWLALNDPANPQTGVEAHFD